MRRTVVAILIAACASTAPHAQAPAGRVTGPITLAVDLRETPRKLLHARETMSVTPGALTLVSEMAAWRTFA